MQNKKIKKTYFIPTDISTGERLLEKSIEYDFQGYYKEYIIYDRNGELSERTITERYKNRIVSERFYKTYEDKSRCYRYQEFIYNGKDLLIETVELKRSEDIATDDYLEGNGHGPWRSDKLEKNYYVSVNKYGYDDKNRIISES